ncbi:TrmB family transcriptional regulator [Natranaeroarchaeum aerophilus]|uniref:TrmB family transcriptional regulator n=1 Tax=Natranaeroarchaeum aerophilus TaxID=2917711 RepID=A0AAE3FQR4_9EURY|nr:TrmB family transcriptional regulator [Natranaeroarchaeum aerophilus]MCL9813549.1 TrmB family transcriptional regulator [Natranaeroarchaeum aerophilus]
MSLGRTTASTHTPTPIPSEIEAPTAKLVYMTLDADGPHTIDELSDRLNMQKLVLLETLRTLESKGIVDANGECCTAN